MSSEAHNIQAEVKKYIAVFIGLLTLTAVTVLASGLKTGLMVGIVLALVIASVKASLVACHFMHLNSEKKIIYVILIFTAIFFAAMMLLFYISYYDVPEGLKYVS